MDTNKPKGKWKRRFSQASLKRLGESIRHNRKLLDTEPDFDKKSWERFYEILGMEVDFSDTEIPIIPVLFKDHKHRKAFRRHFLVMAKKIDLHDALLQLERLCELLDINLKIQKGVFEFAKEHHNDRRSHEEYIIRYPDERGFFHYKSKTIKMIVTSGKPKTMRLVEAILRFIYYVIFHGWSEWDRINKDIVCPETRNGDKIALFAVDNVPQQESKEKPEINSVNDIKKIRKSLHKKMEVFVGFISQDRPLRWDQLPVHVLTKV